MKTVLLFFAALVAVFLAAFGASYAWHSQESLEKLSAENRELRLRGAARARVQNFKKGTPAQVNDEAVIMSSYVMGTPAFMIQAVREQENGSPLWELGHRGKTDWIAEHTPPDQWQYWEAARTMNKAVWAYVLEDPKRRHEVFRFVAKKYTAEQHANKWAKNVEKLASQGEK